MFDDKIADLTEDEAEHEQKRLNRRWTNVAAVVETEKRLRLISRDLVEHFESRVVGMYGKAMIVCMRHRTCFALHSEIVKLRPDWRSDDDKNGVIKIVMIGAASDPQQWLRHFGGQARREVLAKRIKDPNDALKLVIVRDMWLTGFGEPSLPQAQFAGVGPRRILGRREHVRACLSRLAVEDHPRGLAQPTVDYPSLLVSWTGARIGHGFPETRSG